MVYNRSKKNDPGIESETISDKGKDRTEGNGRGIKTKKRNVMGRGDGS